MQLVALPLAALGAYEVARAAGPVLLLFVAGSVISLVLHPVVAGVQRLRVPRPLAVFVVLAGVVLVLVFAGLLLAGPIAGQVDAFREDIPDLAASANASLADVQRSLDSAGIDVRIQDQGSTALGTLQDQIVGGTGELVSFGTDVAERVVTASLALVLVVVISVYMLLYARRIGDGMRRLMPPSAGGQDDYPRRIVRAVAGYVRGQLLFSLAMGTGAGLGLYVVGVLGIVPEGRTYALAFGAFFGAMELVPFIGPILGALPPLIVALFQDPLTAVWLGLFFTALQQIEGHIVAPLIFGATLQLNPLIVIFALLFGGELYGILGALLALPVAAMTRETVLYLREHTVLEPWTTGRSGLP